ncbi:hypothetical protein AB3N59_04740 [Leptospira sp. WS92.C1]
MKKGKVKIQIGVETKMIDFSAVKTILPENLSKKKETELSDLKKEPEFQLEPPLAPAEEKRPPAVSPKTLRSLSALIPGWSPLFFSDDRKIQMTGGMIALSELYILYQGLEFFMKPDSYSESSRPERALNSTAILATNNQSLFVYYHWKNLEMVVTQRGNIMDESEFYEQGRFYGFALLAILSIDFYISRSELFSGSLKSIRLSTTDGGKTSFLSVSWVF